MRWEMNDRIARWSIVGVIIGSILALLIFGDCCGEPTRSVLTLFLGTPPAK
jgi:hypothetical protein